MWETTTMSKHGKFSPKVLGIFLEEFGGDFPDELRDALVEVVTNPECRCPMLAESGPGDEVCLPRAERGHLEQVVAYQMDRAYAKRNRYFASRDEGLAVQVVNHLLLALTAMFFHSYYPKAGQRITSVPRRRPDGTLGYDFFVKGDADGRDNN
jgi:hypothetical protein